MARKVVIRVKPNGTLETDFQGFEGNCCFEEDAKLKAALRKHGLNLGEPESIQCKLGATPLQPRVKTETGT